MAPVTDYLLIVFLVAARDKSSRESLTKALTSEAPRENGGLNVENLCVAIVEQIALRRLLPDLINHQDGYIVGCDPHVLRKLAELALSWKQCSTQAGANALYLCARYTLCLCITRIGRCNKKAGNIGCVPSPYVFNAIVSVLVEMVLGVQDDTKDKTHFRWEKPNETRPEEWRGTMMRCTAIALELRLNAVDKDSLADVDVRIDTVAAPNFYAAGCTGLLAVASRIYSSDVTTGDGVSLNSHREAFLVSGGLELLLFLSVQNLSLYRTSGEESGRSDSTDISALAISVNAVLDSVTIGNFQRLWGVRHRGVMSSSNVAGRAGRNNLERLRCPGSEVSDAVEDELGRRIHSDNFRGSRTTITGQKTPNDIFRSSGSVIATTGLQRKLEMTEQCKGCDLAEFGSYKRRKQENQVAKRVEALMMCINWERFDENTFIHEIAGNRIRKLLNEEDSGSILEEAETEVQRR